MVAAETIPDCIGPGQNTDGVKFKEALTMGLCKYRVSLGERVPP